MFHAVPLVYLPNLSLVSPRAGSLYLYPAILLYTCTRRFFCFASTRTAEIYLPVSMPSPSNAPRSGAREKEEEEYAVFMHPIPHNFRWQEIKDIARTYCAAPVRQADTVEPSHDLGYVLIAGLHSALKAYQGFCENGIAGRKVRVSLNGPYSSRKNFTNAINRGQADKLICNNLAEYDQHQSQLQAVDLVVRAGTRQSSPSTSAILGSYNRNGGRTPRGVRIVNLPGDVSKGELNKFLKRKTGGSVEPDATRIGRNGRFATAQTVFKKAPCAGVAVSEIKAFGRRPVRVEFDEEYEFRTPPRGDDSATPTTSSEGENSRLLASRPGVAVAVTNADVDVGSESDGPVVVDGARGSRHKRPTTDSEDEVDDNSSDESKLGIRSLSILPFPHVWPRGGLRFEFWLTKN
ncbi:hypothetical protein DV737_g1091, partial [Chaetothyriales sp. CBS 132003]